MNSYVKSLTVYDGELIAGGYFTTAGGNMESPPLLPPPEQSADVQLRLNASALVPQLSAAWTETVDKRTAQSTGMRSKAAS